MNPEAIDAAAEALRDLWDSGECLTPEDEARVAIKAAAPYLIREARAAELETAAEEADTMASVSSYSGSEDDMESLLNTATRLRARAAAIRDGEA